MLMCVVMPEGVHDLDVLCRMDRSRGGWAGTGVEHAGAEEVVVQGVERDLTKHGTSRDRG